MLSASNLILFQKSWTVLCWLFKPLSRKTAQWKSLHYHQNDREITVVTFSVFSIIPSEGKMFSKSRSGSWIALETNCIFDEHYCFFLKKTLDYKQNEKRVAFCTGIFPWMSENPVSQRKSDQIVLKCFGRNFVRSFRTEAAKDCCSFVSMIEKSDPNLWKQNLKRK